MTVLTASSTASALTRSTRARQVQVAIMQSRDTLEARKEETGHGEGEGRGEGGGEEYMRERYVMCLTLHAGAGIQS